MGINISLIRTLSCQIRSGNITGAAIAIIKGFLQVLVGIQHLCHVGAARWGCLMGLDTIGKLTVYIELTSIIMPKVGWIPQSLTLLQIHTGSGRPGRKDLGCGKDHDISFLDIFLQLFKICLCIRFVQTRNHYLRLSQTF